MLFSRIYSHSSYRRTLLPLPSFAIFFFEISFPKLQTQTYYFYHHSSAMDETANKSSIDTKSNSVRVAHDVDDEDVWRSSDIELLSQSFDLLNLKPALLSGLIKAGFVKPSKLQAKAIPWGRIGSDLVVQSKSGTGKTCIFAIIALDLVQLDISDVCQVMILAPTREIAFQIAEVVKAIGSDMKGLAVRTFIGGVSIKCDMESLKKCHVAIGTPGRLNQLIEQNRLQTHSIRLLVLDEADKLMDEKFSQQVEQLICRLPSSRQTLAISATFTDEFNRFVRLHMKEPKTVACESEFVGLAGITQYYLNIGLNALNDFDCKVTHLLRIFENVSFTQALVFSNYQTRADYLKQKLNKSGWSSDFISGQHEQKDRLKTMKALKRVDFKVLISTDLIARGVDCEHVNLVVNLDVPLESETYLHRVGRAGRFGRRGLAISLCSTGKEMDRMNEIKEIYQLELKELPDLETIADLWKVNDPSHTDEKITWQQLVDEVEKECGGEYLTYWQLKQKLKEIK